MSNEIPEEKWKAEHAIFREQIPGYSRSGFSFFQGEMFYLAGRNAGQAEIDLYSNAFKTADELRISSAERYDKEIEELKSLIKEATPHVKKSLDSIFEIDLRFSHMIKNKEACEKWLEKTEKIK